MTMTTERRNEISHLIVVSEVQRRGIPQLKPNEIKRNIGNTAKKLGISFEEANEFARELVFHLIEKAFPKEEKPLLGPASEDKGVKKKGGKPLLEPAFETTRKKTPFRRGIEITQV